MRRSLLLALFLLVINRPMNSQEQQKAASGQYLFAWTGDSLTFGKILNPDSQLRTYIAR